VRTIKIDVTLDNAALMARAVLPTLEWTPAVSEFVPGLRYGWGGLYRIPDRLLCQYVQHVAYWILTEGR